MIIVITVVVLSLSHDILLFVVNKKIMYLYSASLKRKKRLYFNENQKWHVFELISFFLISCLFYIKNFRNVLVNPYQPKKKPQNGVKFLKELHIKL